MDKRIEYKDITGFYRDEGSGPVIMLLHGFGMDGSLWDDLVEELKKDFRVLVPDLPGIRHSGLTNESLTIEWIADFAKAIIEKEEVEKIHLLGHSMGGYVVLAFAEKHPVRLESIGLFHSHPFADDKEKIKNRKRSIEFVQKNGVRLFLDELYNNLFSEEFSTNQGTVILGLKEKAYEYSPDALVALTEAMFKRPERTEVLVNFNGPVLFILGKEDKIIPLKSGLVPVSLPEVSAVHILEKAGHMGMVECRVESIDFIRKFVNLKDTGYLAGTSRLP